MSPILFTGAPGIGKSTLLSRLAEVLDSRYVSGVISGEIRIEGKRQGFTVRSFGGAPGVLSSPDLPGEPRFGTLMPDGSRRLKQSGRLGKLPLRALGARRLPREILAMPVPVFASIGLQDHEWMADLRNDRRYPLLELTHRNRDLVAELLVTHIRTVVT